MQQALQKTRLRGTIKSVAILRLNFYSSSLRSFTSPKIGFPRLIEINYDISDEIN